MIDADLVEWNYREYEGLTPRQIHETAPGWLIFRDGCPGQGAWVMGGGDQKITYLGAVEPTTLAEIYQAFDFPRSESLDTIAPVPATGNGGADGSVRPGRTLSGAGTPRGRRTPGARS